MADGAKLPEDVDLAEWDGAAELVVEPPETMAAWAEHSYFEKIIKADGLEFIKGDGGDEMKILFGSIVTGDRKVFIENGKAVVDYTSGQKVWDEWKEKEANKDT